MKFIVQNYKYYLNNNSLEVKIIFFVSNLKLQW